MKTRLNWARLITARYLQPGERVDGLRSETCEQIGKRELTFAKPDHAGKRNFDMIHNPDVDNYITLKCKITFR